jgi:hypothetical protein
MTRKPKFTDEELKWIERMRATLERTKGQPDGVDDLPEYIPLPEEGDEAVAVFIKKKPGKAAAKKKPSTVATKVKPSKTTYKKKSSTAISTEKRLR